MASGARVPKIRSQLTNRLVEDGQCRCGAYQAPLTDSPHRCPSLMQRPPLYIKGWRIVTQWTIAAVKGLTVLLRSVEWPGRDLPPCRIPIVPWAVCVFSACAEGLFHTGVWRVNHCMGDTEWKECRKTRAKRGYGDTRISKMATTTIAGTVAARISTDTQGNDKAWS